MATDGWFMGFLRWLRRKPSDAPKVIRGPQGVVPPKQNLVVPSEQTQEDSKNTHAFSFFVDGPRLQDYTQVGLSVKLWIPKDNPEKVYIYHRDGPGGCLGIVPRKYSSRIIAHLVNGLEYEAEVEERTSTTCKVRCRLLSREESKQRKRREIESLREQLTKAYNPKKPMTLKLTTHTPDAVKVGDKLKIEFGSLDSYLQEASTERGPYSCQWRLAFCDQAGATVGVLEHDKAAIQRILKAHFNAYLLDVEVVETLFHLDYSEEKKRSNWEGYPFRLVITPYKSSDQTSR